MNTARYLAAILLWSMIIGEVITILLAVAAITFASIYWAALPTVFVGSCIIGSPFAWGIMRVTAEVARARYP
jgi:hypothetical protein